MGRIDEPFPSKRRRRGSAELDVYKTKCSDQELTIVQLKLELAESKTVNAHIIRENQTLNNELTGQQTKTGQLLVENIKHKMASIQLRRELNISTMREGLLKKRVDKLNEENVNLRHFAERQTKHTSLGNLLNAKESANGLLSSLSDLFGGDSMGDFKKRHGASSNPGSRSVSATNLTNLSRANSYVLKSCASGAIAGTSSFHGNTAARA